MASSEQGYERLGAKLLSLPDVIAQSIGFIGPVFSSAFVIPLVVGVISASGKGGGVAAPLSVLIAAVGVFALGWVVSSYAKEIHAAGSLYDYVTRGLGERVGTAAGWLYYGGVTILLTGLLLLIGGYLQGTIQSEFGVSPLPSWAWTAILIAVIGAILYFGVRISTRSQLALALISIVVVGIFFIYVIIKLGSANSLKPFNPSSAADGWPGIIFGMLYGVLLFIGFETAANLAEETPNPRRHIPIAVMATAAIATVMYVVATYVEVAGFHYDLKTLTAAAAAPLFALGAPKSAGGYGGVWIDRLLELVVLFDMLAVAIGCAVSASRGIFAMARDRRIPAPLARVSRRHGTPLGATLFVVGASVATLDRLSHGRLVVLPTVSWHRDEYDALGVPFGRRGDILDEQLEIWSRAWAGSPVAFDGRHYRFGEVWLEPQPFRPGGPVLWFGGSSVHPRLIARLVRYGRGFNPLGQPDDAGLARIAGALIAAGRRPSDLEYVGGARGTFAGPDGLADLDQALADIPAQLARGFRTICVKPSQFTDDPAQIGDFCRELVAKVSMLA
jgi:amino acid transporter